MSNPDNHRQLRPLSDIEKDTIKLLETLEAEKTNILPASTRAQQFQSVADFEMWYRIRHLKYKTLREDILRHKVAGIMEGRDDDSPEVVAVYEKLEDIRKTLGHFEKMLRRED
jgi:hypothetical protein